jgi:hypothetical protein
MSSIPDDVTAFHLPNAFDRVMPLGIIQPVTEMSARDIPGRKMRPTRKAGNLTAICEPIV